MPSTYVYMESTQSQETRANNSGKEKITHLITLNGNIGYIMTLIKGLREKRGS